MSTPGPKEDKTPPQEDRITLPAGKTYNIAIDSPNFPASYLAELVFEEDLLNSTWNASFNVPSVLLTEMGSTVSQVGSRYEFSFTLANATTAQQNAGYINGTYTFSFDPPGDDPTEFSGDVDDPHASPGGAVDTFTATRDLADTGE